MARAPMTTWPPSRPQLLREYARTRDFHRHARHLARSGWHPVTVTTTKVPPLLRAANALTLGLLSLVCRLEPAVLVTYSTR